MMKAKIVLIYLAKYCVMQLSKFESSVSGIIRLPSKCIIWLCLVLVYYIKINIIIQCRIFNLNFRRSMEYTNTRVDDVRIQFCILYAALNCNFNILYIILYITCSVCCMVWFWLPLLCLYCSLCFYIAVVFYSGNKLKVHPMDKVRRYMNSRLQNWLRLKSIY